MADILGLGLDTSDFETIDSVASLGTDGLISPDDFLIQKVQLNTSLGPVNLRGLMVELSYYEDIFKSSITGHVLINDSISLIDKLALSGSETIEIQYKKSSQASIQFNRKFRVFRIGERLLKNNATEVYTIHFCSEELLLSEQIKISKSYPGKKISDIVENILKEEMKVNSKRIKVEDTLGIYDFIIPYKKPFEAINWLSSYARPTRNPGADFLFYETEDGFNFKSLQSLYSQIAYRTFSYGLRTAGQRGRASEIGSSITNIKSYNFLDTFDSLYATNLGMFANKTISIDPLTRQYYTTVFDYSKYLKNAKTLNGRAVVSENKNILGKTAYQNSDAVLKVLTTNRNQKKAKGINPSTVANDVGVETYVPNRTAQLALSQYSRIKMSVSGDPSLSAGYTINVILPSMRSKDGTGYQSGEKDLYHSGKYIITAVRHIIDVNMKYETILEIAKDSLEATLPFNNSSPNIQTTAANPSAPTAGGVLRNN